MSKKTIGIRENLGQFILLLIINIFVGSMVGIERTILPLLGEGQFQLASTSAVLSFIVSFGFSKAVVNYFAGEIADKWQSRKKVLLVGWLAGLFVPVLIIIAKAWWVIVCANVLLGVNQGLAWSMTVNMKMDISNNNQRGTAVGLNEFAGYSGVAIMAAVSGYIASSYYMRPHPFYLGIGIAIIGVLLSLTVQDTGGHLKSQTQDQPQKYLSSQEIFCLTTWKDRNLSSICFSGLATNLKDGMVWGLFPLYLASGGLDVHQMGTVVAVYPAAWGFFQLFTGIISDKIGRKKLIAGGMFTQAFALWFFLAVNSYFLWLMGAISLGLGTAMVYPTLQAAISDVSAPNWRASSMGVYRFWRDCGYAFGALMAGLLADYLGATWAIGLVAILPFLAGVSASMRMRETLVP
ncbi:MAG: MFS transporter [Peptococcales bacterium]